MKPPRFVDVLDEIQTLALGAALEKDERILVMALIGKARRDAAEALKRLAIIDPTDLKSIKWCQDEIQRYSDIVRWIRECKREAREVYAALDAKDREAIDEAIYGDDEITDH